MNGYANAMIITSENQFQEMNKLWEENYLALQETKQIIENIFG
jgi:hypothetical protein